MDTVTTSLSQQLISETGTANTLLRSGVDTLGGERNGHEQLEVIACADGDAQPGGVQALPGRTVLEKGPPPYNSPASRALTPIESTPSPLSLNMSVLPVPKDACSKEPAPPPLPLRTPPRSPHLHHHPLSLSDIPHHHQAHASIRPRLPRVRSTPGLGVQPAVAMYELRVDPPPSPHDVVVSSDVGSSRRGRRWREEEDDGEDIEMRMLPGSPSERSGAGTVLGIMEGMEKMQSGGLSVEDSRRRRNSNSRSSSTYSLLVDTNGVGTEVDGAADDSYRKDDVTGMIVDVRSESGGKRSGLGNNQRRSQIDDPGGKGAGIGNTGTRGNSTAQAADGIPSMKSVDVTTASPSLTPFASAQTTSSSTTAAAKSTISTAVSFVRLHSGASTQATSVAEQASQSPPFVFHSALGPAAQDSVDEGDYLAPYMEEMLAQPERAACSLKRVLREAMSLLRRLALWLTRAVPRGGTLSSVFNLSSFVLGAGIISIPSAFNTSGIIMSVVYLLIVTVLTVYSITLLVTASEKTGFRSFESMAHGLFGPGCDIVVATLIWLLCFGSSVGYVVAVGDVVGPILNFPSAPPFLRSDTCRRIFQALVWLLFMFPVALPKHVNSLRYVSTAGVSVIMLFVVCVVVHSARNGMKDGLRSDLALVRGGNRAVSGLAIFMFAYLCQVNSFKVYNEMVNRSITRMTKDTIIACTFCCTTYLITGFFGYADFGNALSGSILRYYDPHSSVFFLLIYAGIVVKLCASFALNMLACRTALFQVLRWDVDSMPFWKHSVVAASFASGALFVGLLVPDINMVFGLVGAFCGGFIGFIFPALFIMYSGNWGLKQVGWFHYISTYVLLVAGVIGVVFGTVTSIYATATSP